MQRDESFSEARAVTEPTPGGHSSTVGGVSDSRATRQSYDRVAERYAAEVGGELAQKPLDRALLNAFAELATGGVVVDAGCGPGHVAAYLADHGAQVIGADLSPAMCALASRETVPALAADMTALPFRDEAVAGVVSLYAVIHLDEDARLAAYREFARVLRPGGHALIAFHTSDAETPTGGTMTREDWWDQPVDLTFRFLDPDQEVRALALAGLGLVARLDREPVPEHEHPSRRSYLVLRRD
jgi:SAM-dependent methyltransferase